MYYNSMVPLPMSLSLVRERLGQGYYRQVQGVMGDVATIAGNARAFNGDHSQVTDLAAGHAPAIPLGSLPLTQKSLLTPAPNPLKMSWLKSAAIPMPTALPWVASQNTKCGE